jgi:mRNA-degrading endonuclease RelE of RelBE toxin-antitoxin system
VTEDRWNELNELKEAGQTYDELLAELVREHRRRQLADHVSEVREAETDELTALDEKSQRIVTQNLRKLEDDPYPQPGSGRGDKQKLVVEGEEMYRLHIGRTHTAFYAVVEDRSEVRIVDIMTIDEAHDRYGSD